MKVLTIAKWKIIFVFATILLTYQNCAFVGPQQSLSSSSSASILSKQALLEAKAMGILRTSCAGCHNASSPGGGIDYMMDINALKYYRLVIPGEPQLSELYDSIATGRMPKSSTLTQDQIKAIYDWIFEGMSGTAVPVNAPPASSATLVAKYSSISAKILVPKCLGCHGSANPAGGYSVATYNGVMALVQPGNAAASGLYDSTLKNRMPKNGVPLSSQELTAISDWILSGALQN